MNTPILISGRRYTMPDGATGKFIGRNPNSGLYFFRLAGAVFASAGLTAEQAATITEAVRS